MGQWLMGQWGSSPSSAGQLKSLDTMQHDTAAAAAAAALRTHTCRPPI